MINLLSDTFYSVVDKLSVVASKASTWLEELRRNW